ncbi:GTP pyrophosphokinase [Lysinibacillus xylanilyticus]|uniref:GTP pyrophosphokinase n=1 Tax=Lysinibacillus xylanilyticus TaxID=582475 RepID=UPI0038243635
MVAIALDKKDDIEAIENEYSQRLNIYKQLADEGKHTLQHALQETNIKIHTILSRVKEIESFLGKVKRKEIEKPFEEINDIVGIRIVCLFLSDIEKIEKVIADKFEVISIDNKINNTENSNMFGYMSAHYIVKFKEQFTGPRYDSIKNMNFEIQVRTISMDAWANISHFLEYKNENDIPQELKRDFNALSGLFYVADTHFEMFYKQSQTNKQIVLEKVDEIIHKKVEHTIEQPLNLDSLTAYLHTKFPNRRHIESEYISQFLTDLFECDYKTVESVDRIVDNNFETFLAFEEIYPPGVSPYKYADLGVVGVTLALADENFRKNSHVVTKHYDDFVKKINA